MYPEKSPIHLDLAGPLNGRLRVHVKEPNISAKEPYISGKEPYTATRAL